MLVFVCVLCLVVVMDFDIVILAFISLSDMMNSLHILDLTRGSCLCTGSMESAAFGQGQFNLLKHSLRFISLLYFFLVHRLRVLSLWNRSEFYASNGNKRERQILQ